MYLNPWMDVLRKNSSATFFTVVLCVMFCEIEFIFLGIKYLFLRIIIFIREIITQDTNILALLELLREVHTCWIGARQMLAHIDDVDQ